MRIQVWEPRGMPGDEDYEELYFAGPLTIGEAQVLRKDEGRVDLVYTPAPPEEELAWDQLRMERSAARNRRERALLERAAVAEVRGEDPGPWHTRRLAVAQKARESGSWSATHGCIVYTPEAIYRAALRGGASLEEANRWLAKETGLPVPADAEIRTFHTPWGSYEPYGVTAKDGRTWTFLTHVRNDMGNSSGGGDGTSFAGAKQFFICQKPLSWLPGFLRAAYDRGVNPLPILREMFPGEWGFSGGLFGDKGNWSVRTPLSSSEWRYDWLGTEYIHRAETRQWGLGS